MARYINVCECKIQNTILSDVHLEDARIISNITKNISIDKTILNNSEIVNTSLKNVDLSTSNINNISIDFYSIKGIKVNSEQAVLLATLLGVIIK